MIKKDLIVVVIVTFCLTFVLFGISPTRSASNPYDPWLDTNDDGVINMRDIGVMCDMFGASGTPINKTAMLLDLQNRVNALEEKQNRVKTIRFYTQNETMNDQPNEFKEAATFYWVPGNATNNAILSVYCYLQYKGTNIRCVVWGFWDGSYNAISGDYIWIGWQSIGMVAVPTPNQANYTLTILFYSWDSQPVYVKDINLIIEVMDGLPAN